MLLAVCVYNNMYNFMYNNRSYNYRFEEIVFISNLTTKYRYVYATNIIK